MTPISGRGLFAFAAYTGTPSIETLLEAMQADFPNSKIDMSGKNIARLRYATSDPDIIIKDEVCPAVLTERTESADVETVKSVQEHEPKTPIQPSQPFPVDALPSVMRDIVRTIAKAQCLQADYFGTCL